MKVTPQLQALVISCFLSSQGQSPSKQGQYTVKEALELQKALKARQKELKYSPLSLKGLAYYMTTC